MTTDTRPPRVLQRAALVLLLAAVSSGCDKDTPSGDEPTESMGTGEGEPRGEQPAGEWTPPASDDREDEVILTGEHFHGVGAYLPRPADSLPWIYTLEPEYYTASNLAELYDGGAAAYQEAGFDAASCGLLQMREVPESIGRPVGLEICVLQMSTSEAALATYTDHHDTSTCEQTPVAGERIHCLTSSSIDVLDGPLYVRFILDAEDPSLTEPLFAAVREVLMRLPATQPNTAAGTGEGTGADN